MPRVELYNDELNNTCEVAFKPAEGELRMKGNSLEKMDSFNTWNYVCDLQKMDSDVINHELKIQQLEDWRFREELKTEDSIKAVELEAEWGKLKEAGDHLRVLEEQCKQAREYMRRMEEVLRLGRIAYDDVVKYTLEKKKTFDILDTDLENSEAESI